MIAFLAVLRVSPAGYVPHLFHFRSTDSNAERRSSSDTCLRATEIKGSSSKPTVGAFLERSNWFRASVVSVSDRIVFTSLSSRISGSVLRPASDLLDLLSATARMVLVCERVVPVGGE